jgi:hypothetical protein
MRDRRTFSALVGGGLLLALFWPTTSSAPAVPVNRPPLPSNERLAMLSELTHWTHGSGRDFSLFGEGPLPALARNRPRGFALFAAEGDAEGRRQLLADVPYGELIFETAERYRLDGLLLAAMVQVESGFDAAAISPRGAQGLMQLMPMTAESYGASKPADPRANVRAGARYLRDLIRSFDGDLELALAAYNAGPAAVRRFRGMPPYRETRNYVERVLTLYLGYHRTLWQEDQLEQMMARLPPLGSEPAVLTEGSPPAALPAVFAVDRQRPTVAAVRR